MSGLQFGSRYYLCFVRIDDHSGMSFAFLHSAIVFVDRPRVNRAAECVKSVRLGVQWHSKPATWLLVIIVLAGFAVRCHRRLIISTDVISTGDLQRRESIRLYSQAAARYLSSRSVRPNIRMEHLPCDAFCWS